MTSASIVRGAMPTGRSITEGKSGHVSSMYEARTFQVGKLLGVENLSDWYQVRGEDFRKCGGGPLLSKYGGSLSALLRSVYPSHSWSSWKFQSSSKSVWNDWKNVEQFLQELELELEMERKEDWYLVTSVDFTERGGASLLERYGSVCNLLKKAFPSHPWNAARFKKERDEMDAREFQLECINRVAKEAGVKDLEDWYSVGKERITKAGGGALLRKYGHSVAALFQSLYPEHEWHLWRFRQGLEALETEAELVRWLEQQLKVKSPDEWYRVSLRQIREVIPLSCFGKQSLEQMLLGTHQNHPWDIAKLNFKRGTIKASQRMLAGMVEEIFPQSGIHSPDLNVAEVKENYIHHEMERSDSERKIELDVFLPREKLAFEYQGQHHYYDIFSLGQKWQQRAKDEEKRSLCQEHDITLIEIPYWWNFSKSSLVATIHQVRSDLTPMPGNGSPIPKEPPGGFPKGAAPQLMHGETWDGKQDLKGWIMSEKLDGVRALWTGSRLISKNGKDIRCPEWFKEGLPTGFSLDGELWMGRGMLEDVLAVLNSEDSIGWKSVKYVVFDLPNSKQIYEIRSEEVKNLKLPKHATVLQVQRCESNDHLLQYLDTVVKNGGEGVMANKPDSPYVTERTTSLLKVKVRVPNAVHSVDGKRLRRAAAVCGSNRIVLPAMQAPYANWTKAENRKRFFDELRQKLELRSLEDFYAVTLEDVAQHGGQALLSQVFGNSMFTAMRSVYPDHKWLAWKFSQAPLGFWDSKSNQKQFVDWLAKQLKFNNMEDWYTIGNQSIIQNGGRSLLAKYGQSPSVMLQHLYPEHDWKIWMFKKVPKGYWKSEETHSSYLEWLAKRANVKELTDWYRVWQFQIPPVDLPIPRAQLGPSKVHMNHFSSPSSSLFSFPPKCPPCRNSLHSAVKGALALRARMDDVGGRLGVVKLEDWYHIKTKDLKSVGASSLLNRFQHSLHKALSAAYPEHSWLPWKFDHLPDGFWANNAKEYLEWLAGKLGIKEMEEWYHIQKADLLHKEGERVGLPLIELLRLGYPEHEWQAWRFPKVPDNYWNSWRPTEMRELLERVSEELKINSLEDWYRVSLDQIAGVVPSTAFRKQGGLSSVLPRLFPDHSWDSKRLLVSRTSKSAQWKLKKLVESLFSDTAVYEEYDVPDLRFVSGDAIRLDVFVPKHQLAFEYQGEQHYHSIYVFGAQEDVVFRDEQKKLLCAKRGIALVEIPYWWDLKKDRVVRAIQQHIPSLELTDSEVGK